jgi:hypothetical protein
MSYKNRKTFLYLLEIKDNKPCLPNIKIMAILIESEILILGALGIVIILAIFLCFLEFRRCAQNFFDGRRRKKRETPEKNMMKNI